VKIPRSLFAATADTRSQERFHTADATAWHGAYQYAAEGDFPLWRAKGGWFSFAFAIPLPDPPPLGIQLPFRKTTSQEDRSSATFAPASANYASGNTRIGESGGASGKEAAMRALVRVALGVLVLLVSLPGARCASRTSAGAGEDAMRDDAFAVSRDARNALKPLHLKKRPPQPGDWLSRFGDEEKGQSLEEYLSSDPLRPDAKRGTLYILLLGEFSKERKEIVDLTAEFMGLYFSLPVKFADPVDEKGVPAGARRRHPSWGMPQIHAGWVLDELLKPRVPADAVALIAFTSSDLWPGEGWNFVFGMASLSERVGVWSLNRFGDPAAGSAQYARCLLHTIKTGTHETGHMLGMLHCIAYECNMNGSNHLAEAERQPLALCPECAPKLWWACRCDPVKRYRDLEAFCRKHGFAKEADFYRRSRAAIEPIFACEGKKRGPE